MGDCIVYILGGVVMSKFDIDKQRFDEIVWTDQTEFVYDLAPESPGEDGQAILRKVYRDGTIERGHWIDGQFVVID